MKIVFATIFFNFLCIIFFGMIYIYLKNEFINNANKNDVQLIDIIMFSTTIQSGVGLSNLLPNSFNLKLVTIIQQLTMICSYVIILYIITKKFHFQKK
jgi:hypothetical protein